MNPTELSTTIGAVKQSIAAFLKTVLGKDVPVELAPPAPAADLLSTVEGMRILSPAVLTPDWYVYLEEAWIPTLSGSMIGEPMEPDQEGADDLLREVTTQAFASVRRALAERHVDLPEMDMVVQPAGEPPPPLSPTAAAARMTIDAGGQQLTAFIVLRDASFLTASAAPSGPKQGDIPVSSAGFPELGPETIGSGDGSNANFELMAEVQLEISVELGRRSIPLADLLRLTTGSVIELEKLVGEPLEVYANGRLIAEGEAVVIDEQFGIRITRLASVRQRAKAFSR